MTSEQLEKICAENERAWSHDNPNCPTEVATYMMMCEVAYQLALLNEGFAMLTENRNASLRVMVEPGEWPIQVQEAKR